MDTRTGKIRQIYIDEMTEFEKRMSFDNRAYSIEDKMVALTGNEVESWEAMGLQQRKGWMRNHPCVCGSGKKFKKCCWDKFSGTGGCDMPEQTNRMFK